MDVTPDASQESLATTEIATEARDAPTDTAPALPGRMARLHELLAGPMNPGVRLEALDRIQAEIEGLGCGALCSTADILLLLAFDVHLREDT